MKRIQRKRTPGWKMPPNTVSVTRPGKWGNPFYVGMVLTPAVGIPFKVRDAAHAVKLFREQFYPCPAVDRALEMMRRELGGKNLACWCKEGEPCHADVLLKLANPTRVVENR